VLVVLAMSIFTVDQRQHAIVFQLGEVKEVIPSRACTSSGR
jgi:membrane protease subunit HflC